LLIVYSSAGRMDIARGSSGGIPPTSFDRNVIQYFIDGPRQNLLGNAADKSIHEFP
jgi:hypothetical protein